MKRMILAMASLFLILWLTTPAQPQPSDQTGTFEISNQRVAHFPEWARVPDVKVVSGDFDGDGKVDDIALVAERLIGLGVAYGQGGGNFTDNSFQLAPDLAVSGAKIVSGDFDGDGRIDDIAMVGGSGWGTIPVAYGQAAGNFTVTNKPVPNFAGWAAVSGTKIVSGDFDGDGKIDDIAMVGGSDWRTIPVAYGQGGGNFSVSNHEVEGFPGWAAVSGAKIVSGDFDGDGKIDDIAMVGGSDWRTIPVAYGQGGGTFSVSNHEVEGFPGWAAESGTKIVAGDFDADGKIDDIAMVGGSEGTTIPVAYGQGGGEFTITNQHEFDFAGWAQASGTVIVSGDFDGDSRHDDIAMVGGPDWATIPVAYAWGQ